ncbi:acyl carrier protein [Streptomyces sp. UNOC14_S4]|uniref:acyl carrier protein n=1 Tax=Streptomyces sp. UNOC14_S4 TaxID=2872340 RepID=UPI001E417B12|nr:acyl carrier protein [Streptomyces sp. UNOC14_S4]MCC3767170.1 acyl carrier protein [Streptomyces sp. UNOC14_S4]
MSPDASSLDDIRSWLIERIAFYLEAPAESIDPVRKFVELGLDSVYALTMCGDIEDHFDIVVEPTVAWDHPTVDTLAAHLHGQAGNR